MQFCSAPFLFLLITGKLTYPNNLELGRTGSKESHCWIRKPLHCPSTVNWARSKNPTAESENLWTAHPLLTEQEVIPLLNQKTSELPVHSSLSKK